MTLKWSLDDALYTLLVSFWFFCQLFYVFNSQVIIIIIIIIIVIIIILGISFMQGICTYIPETNHAPREHCVATILM